MKKALSVLLTLLVMAGVIAAAPVMASAATWTASNATELAAALSSAASGDTIKLLADITYTSTILIDGNTVTFDLNGKTLELTNWLDVRGGGSLLLADPNNGAFNVTYKSTVIAVVEVHANSRAEISNVAVTTTASNTALYAHGANAEIMVYGNVTHTSTTGTGVWVDTGANVTVGGAITVPVGAQYIQLESTAKTQAQYTAPTTKPGYLTYTDGTNTVWVRERFAVTVSNGTGSGNYAAGETVSIAAIVPAGKVFDGWAVAGAALANPASASTIFVMPANAVTAVASFKDAPVTPPKTIFNTGRAATFLNWILFIVCFGWLWM